MRTAFEIAPVDAHDGTVAALTPYPDPKHYNLVASPDWAAAIRRLRKKGFVAHGREDRPPHPFNVPFCWAENPYSDQNWMHQLHAWRMLDPFLERLAAEPESPGIFEEPLQIVLDWWRAETGGQAGHFAWQDMASSLRALKLAFLVQMARTRGTDLPQQIDRMIERHIDELADPTKLSPNNHGLFQLHGLMACVALWPDNPRAAAVGAYAASEMDKLIAKQFGLFGVHTENSPAYHFFALERLDVMLDAPWWVEAVAARAKLEQARLAGLWLVDPAGRTPSIGDSTEGHRVRDFSMLRDWPHAEQGRFLGAKVDGYGVVRSDPATSVANSTMLFLTASFQSSTHKHADCLSFVWQDRGEYLLIDSGKYGYQKDVWRKHFVSTAAHNTIEIGGRRVRRSKEYAYGSGLKRVAPLERCWLIEAEADWRTEGLVHRRQVLFRPHRFVLVLDHLDIVPSPDWRERPIALSVPKRTVTSYWHFNPRHKVLFNEDGVSVVELAGGRSLRVSHRAIGENPSARLYSGETRPQRLGWVSAGYLRRKPAPVIGFKAHPKHGYFAATLFEVCEPGGSATLRLASDRSTRRVRLYNSNVRTGRGRNFSIKPFDLSVDSGLL